MKAFYVFLFLAFIGMVFAKDIFNRQQESCPPPQSGCEGLISIVIKILTLLGYILSDLCEGSEGPEVAANLCLIGCCPA
ncbi:hypothetical protein ALC57_12176 [Trachymyrmex cornetzi]|uniref:Uncharacterized protein n=1 Tax=Trachymyrmex cornetzi TaxID=471704 RepID=A0A151J191_9HYME|nr:hypothetical protein ALC57_12176 [Trachymyrmex cornetzi]